MPKELVNNRINYHNNYGRVIQHDIYLNQGVRDDDSPTFSNLRLTGDATIEGNLYVEGNTTVLSTSVVEFEDNIVLLNNLETGSGISLHQAGLELDRGILENYRIVYDENTETVRVGVISNLQPVAIREDSPLPNGIQIWNDITKRTEARNHIDIDISFTSTTNSISSTSGSLKLAGGLGVKKDIFIDGKIFLTGSNLPNFSSLFTDPGTNSLNVSSVQDIILRPSQRVRIPFNTPLVFGSNEQGVSSDGLTSNLNIFSAGDINLTPTANKKVNIPNQIPLTFSTQNERILTDSSNNLVIESSQDILLKPANGNGIKRVLVPVNTPLAFGNSNQQIVSNTNNDLSVNAANNIFLNPGNGLNVRIPTDNGLKLGGTGNQKISSNSSNDLKVESSGDIKLMSSSHVSIPESIPLTFSDYNQSIVADTNGTLFINASNKLQSITRIHVSNTDNSTCATNGSIHTDGGLGVTKDICCESSVMITSQNNDALQISNPNNETFIFNVSSTDLGLVSVIAGDGTKSNPALELSNTSGLYAKNLLQFKTAFDQTSGYMIGRGSILSNSGRNLSVNLPDQSDYSSGSLPKFCVTSNDGDKELFSVESDTGNIYTLGTLGLGSTIDSTSPTTGSFVVYGGLGVVKNIYTSGKYVSTVSDTNAFQVNDISNNQVVNIDTVNNVFSVNQDFNVNRSSNNAFVVSDGTSSVYNIDTINSKIINKYQTFNTNPLDSNDTSSGSMILSGGLSVQKNISIGGSGNFYGGVDMHNTGIKNLLNPSRPQDAATKAYVDLVKQGLFVKDSVKVATTEPLDFNLDFVQGSIIDGYTLLLDDRILIKDQSNGIENGIYIVTSSGVPERALDLQDGTHASGTFIFVQNGVMNGSLGWICNSPSFADNVGSVPLNYTQFTGLGQVVAGDALSKNFNQLDVNVDNASLEISNDSLRIKSSAAGTGLTGGSGDPLQTTTDQSHVTKLGTINTGVWQGSIIEVPYGGTGRTVINSGSILFGNGTNPISTDSKLFFNNSTTRLGLGTSNPLKDFHVQNTNTVTVLLDADSDGNNPNAKPEIKLNYSGSYSSSIGMTRNFNEYAMNVYSDALVVSNDQTDSTSIIQLSTNQWSRMTILSNGNIGINTSTPGYKLDVLGNLRVSDNVKFENTDTSTNSSTGSVVVSGGVAITSNANSSDTYNGGALTVNGGAAILQDLYVGGQINAVTGSSTFAYLTLTATDESINLTSGALVAFGGITSQCLTDAGNSTNGGSFLTPGGAAIGKQLFVGGTLTSETDTFLGNVYFTSTSHANFIESPNTERDTDSFLPIHFTKYSNTASNIVTLSNSGVVINKSLQIGGTLASPDGYTLEYIPQNLNITPYNTNSTYNINVGTIGSLSNINIFGSDSIVSWESETNNLLFKNSSIELSKVNDTGSLIIDTPNTSGSTFIKALGSDMTLNLGRNSSGGQLTTVLSNDIGNSSITFEPSNVTNSTLVITNSVTATFDGPVLLTDRVEYSGNALHQTVTNESGASKWIYLGKINSTLDGINEIGYCEIDFANGINTHFSSSSGLRLIVAINGTSCQASHLHYGELSFDSINKPICKIFQDTSSNYHLFTLLPGNSQTNINVTAQRSNKFVILEEGTLSIPDGSSSGYSVNWSDVYSTNKESTLSYTFGDVTIEGINTKISDNMPIIGYNNINTISSRDLGILYQRYQKPNDTASGDIVSGTPKFSDSIPNQSTASLQEIKLSNLASSVDDYYKGWWIKVFTGASINQVRQISSYNGSQRLATLTTPFTMQNPSSGDTVYLYNNTYVVNYYDEVDNTFSLSYTHNPDKNITNGGNADLRLNHLLATDTTVSTNVTTGSIYTLGSIAISNTNDATSSTSGATFTSAGGVGISKSLFVGKCIGIGESGFIPQESLHIKKSDGKSALRLENSINQHSYIDFVENNNTSTNNRYGIVLDSSSNIFSLSYSGSGHSPDLSNKALSVISNGYIGINTTSNIYSPLSMKFDNFISTNSSSGFLGLIGGATNINNNTIASRILLNSNNSDVSSGSLNIYAGNVTNGNVSVFTNNDIERVRVDNAGSVHILSTEFTKSSTSGSLLVSGGVAINCTENSSSFIDGGSLTVNGGASVAKNLYLGGDLFISGNLNAAGSVTTPIVSFSNEINCTFNEYHDNTLITISSNGILTFGFTVFPIESSMNTEIEFTLPGRTNSFVRRSEVIVNISGYVDDSQVIPIFNCIGVAQTGTTRGLIKFQSVSTNVHYFQVSCQYIIA